MVFPGFWCCRVLGRGMIARHDADWWRGLRRCADGLGLAGGVGLVGAAGCGWWRGGGGRGGGAAGPGQGAAAGGGGLGGGGWRGGLPRQGMVYLVMALALFADDDYEEVAARLAEALRGWGGGDQVWDPTPGGITQARQRLGPEPLAEVFSQVAVPVADLDTIGAFL